MADQGRGTRSSPPDPLVGARPAVGAPGEVPRRRTGGRRPVGLVDPA